MPAYIMALDCCAAVVACCWPHWLCPAGAAAATIGAWCFSRAEPVSLLYCPAAWPLLGPTAVAGHCLVASAGQVPRCNAVPAAGRAAAVAVCLTLPLVGSVSQPIFCSSAEPAAALGVAACARAVTLRWIGPLLLLGLPKVGNPPPLAAPIASPIPPHCLPQLTGTTSMSSPAFLLK